MHRIKEFSLPIGIIIYLVSSIVFLFSTFVTKAESKEKNELYLRIVEAKLENINIKIDIIKSNLEEKKKK